MIAKAYMTSYRLPVITTRSNNVYGPKQFPEKLIGKFTLLASRNEDLPIHGDGEPASLLARHYHTAVCVLAVKNTQEGNRLRTVLLQTQPCTVMEPLDVFGIFRPPQVH